ncbi:5'-3' exonuclease PLD3-like [Dermatophagoides farinae]|uniref:5'-3' exonuclease PLD3-like n=1 Tax=Dermatophagoides farinae TaxID=6954 RepID=UPI003F5DD1E2
MKINNLKTNDIYMLDQLYTTIMFPMTIVSFILLILMMIIFLVSGTLFTRHSFIVETLPHELNYNDENKSKPTADAWLELINSANHSIDIASMYWTMFGKDVMQNPVPESKKGEKFIAALIDAAKNRSIRLRIAVNDEKSNDNDNNEDLKLLQKYSKIRRVNFVRLIGAGVLHTKFIIVDRKDFYIGSANMDWRSLTHVKELGIIIQNNPELAEDLLKIFDIYWSMGEQNSVIPMPWPSIYDARYNVTNPYRNQINPDDDEYSIFLTSSPRQFCSSTRTNDLDAIIDIINEAEKFIYIAVMDYYPLFLYEKKSHYWPIIDNALRRAVWERNVHVRLLASHWNDTRPYMSLFLKSLQALNDGDNENTLNGSIETKLFTFPMCPFIKNPIPYSEVNHNKYMITDKVVYIGTSNWSADYFVNTAGVGIVMNVTTTNSKHSTSLYNQIQSIFLRDWNSNYAKNIG